MRLLYILIMLGTAFAGAQRAPATVPPDAYEGRLRLNMDTVTFCIDARRPFWELEREIGTAVAQALLLKPEFQLVEPQFTEEIRLEEYFVLLADHCDAVMGLALGTGAAYPDFMAFTRPYMIGRYVLASPDRSFSGIREVAEAGDQKLGVLASGSANVELSRYLAEYGIELPRRVYPTDEALLEGLLSGEVSVALIWEPALVSILEKPPSEAGLLVGRPAPLPRMEWPLGMGVMAGNTYLRELLSEAIAALVDDGVIQGLLREAMLPPDLAAFGD